MEKAKNIKKAARRRLLKQKKLLVILRVKLFLPARRIKSGFGKRYGTLARGAYAMNESLLKNSAFEKGGYLQGYRGQDLFRFSSGAPFIERFECRFIQPNQRKLPPFVFKADSHFFLFSIDRRNYIFAVYEIPMFFSFIRFFNMFRTHFIINGQFL